MRSPRVHETCKICSRVVPGEEAAYLTTDALDADLTVLCRECANADDSIKAQVGGSDAAERFQRAWQRFGESCFDTVAPEATYQAWLAHFLMEEFSVLQVVREVDFGARYLDEQARQLFKGSNLMLDVMVLREPLVQLPRRAWLSPTANTDPAAPRSGLARLSDFAVISELKVAATQGGGLSVGSVVRDVHKLDALLRAAQSAHP